MDVDVLIPSASYSDDAEAAVMIISPYTSITKKIGGRMHLGINVGAGIDMLSLSGTQTIYFENYTYTFGIMAPGVKFGVDLGYMLTPDLNLNFGAGYKPSLSQSVALHTLFTSLFFLNTIFCTFLFYVIKFFLLKTIEIFYEKKIKN